MASGNDPFSSLDPFGSGAFVTGNNKTKTQSPLPNLADVRSSFFFITCKLKCLNMSLKMHSFSLVLLK